MKIIANMSIKMKILVMLMAPISGLLYFSGYSVLENSQVVAEMESVKPLAELAVKASGLVHETQKERGYTAGFLGSKGKKFVTELPAQRKHTDQRRAELEVFLTNFDSAAYGDEFSAKLNEAMGLLSQIGGKRSAVSVMGISAKEAIGYYSGFNASMLALIGHMTALTNDGKLSRAIAAYYNFLQGKERAGIERAVMSNTFARNDFGPGMYDKFSDLVTRQDTYNTVFLSLATPGAKAFYAGQMRDSAVAEVERMRQVAYTAKGNFDIDPVHWFKTITTKINRLKDVENWLSEQLVSQVEEELGAARASQGFFIVLAVMAGLIALIMAFYVVRNITTALGSALYALNDIAEGDGDLTQRLDDSGKDEIAQLAGAFNRFVAKVESMIGKIKETAGSINARGVMKKVLEYFPGQILATPIRENVSLAESMGFGKTIYEYRRKSIGADDYTSLAKTLRLEGQCNA